ncbi:hypothetical protein [Streptomyces sp. NPDC098781]|uniref:hypothetical protein n=1 Tax=Streptomyces sp. NPDC098781 TaxID=3366097 RepID=UPI003830C282
MALVEDPDMIQIRRGARPGVLLLGALLSAALVAGCTTGSEDESTPSKAPKPTASSPNSEDEEQANEELVERALRTGEMSDLGDLFVEAGLERVSDGIHAYSTAANGKAFTLSVACSGSGKVRLTVALKRPLKQTMACDGVPVHQRVHNPPDRVKIDVDGLPESSGMVGWRIDELAE